MIMPLINQLSQIQTKELIAEHKINAKLVECFSSDYFYVKVDGDEIVLYAGNSEMFEVLTIIDINLYNYNVNKICRQIVEIIDKL